MSKYDYNVFFVSSLGINDVAKRGEGISAPVQDDDLDAELSPAEDLKWCLQKHWRNPDESPLLAAYRNEQHANELAHQLVREGKEATIVVIYMRKIAGQGVQFRDARALSKGLDVWIPDHLNRYSESEYLFFHHIPDFGITEVRQVRQVGKA